MSGVSIRHTCCRVLSVGDVHENDSGLSIWLASVPMQY